MACLKHFPKFVRILCTLTAGAWSASLWAARVEMPSLPVAHGYSRLLITERTAPAGSPFAGVPAATLAGVLGVRMAYEAALGNDQYILKLFDNVSLQKAQAISKALMQDPAVLSTSVINERQGVLWRGVLYQPLGSPGHPVF